MATPNAAGFDPIEITERFFTVVKSLNEFDKLEVRGVMNTLLIPKDRDVCFVGIYSRTYANVESILVLKKVSDFQAIAMLARTLMELAIDVTLIGIIPESIKKMLAFVDVEKLRSARRISEFKRDHPNAIVDAAYENFVNAEGTRIDAERKALWPGIKNTDLRHWAHLNMAERAKLIGGELEELHAVYYAQLSLYVHSGLTGIVNLRKETFRTLSALAFNIIIKSYMAVMVAMITEYKIVKANENINEKMDLARTLPFTTGAEQADALTQALLGERSH
jgi:hypothetical protein